MSTDELHILPEDKQAAHNRIVELEKEIQDLGPEFYDVFNQSSETWHDNAPFDALRDRQSVLAAELQSLRGILKNAAISVPKQKKNTIGIGSHVTILNTDLQISFKYYIAGDWTYRTGEKINESIVMSTKAPLAQALLGKKVGDSIHFRHPFTVQAIDLDS